MDEVKTENMYEINKNWIEVSFLQSFLMLH